LFLIVWTVLRRGKGVRGTWLRTLIAGALMATTTLYQYYVFTTNPVFRARAATPTFSPELLRYVVGYGIPFALAATLLVIFAFRVIGLRMHVSSAESLDDEVTSPQPPPRIRRGSQMEALDQDGMEGDHLTPPPGLREGDHLTPPPALRRGLGGGPWPFHDLQTFVLIACWFVAGLSVIYLRDLHGHPVLFQRKTIMGEHVPLCLLAGASMALLLKYVRPMAVRAVLAALLILASAPSNLLFLARDIRHLRQNRSENGRALYLSNGFADALSWLRDNAPPNAAVFGFPEDCLYVPGLAGRAVWSGHWSETPDFGQKVAWFYRFANASTPDDYRPEFLAMMHIDYMLYPTDPTIKEFTSDSGAHYIAADFARIPPRYLTKVYSNPEYSVFRVNVAR
jgi:hypothetical protein